MGVFLGVMYYNEFLSPNAQIIAAAGRDDLPLLKKSLNRGADINTQIQTGLTPLMYACSRKSYSIVEYLLSKGADPNILDSKKWTALMFACRSLDLKTVKLLIAYGARTDIKNSDGQTAKDIAASFYGKDIVEYLAKLPSQ